MGFIFLFLSLPLFVLAAPPLAPALPQRRDQGETSDNNFTSPPGSNGFFDLRGANVRTATWGLKRISQAEPVVVGTKNLTAVEFDSYAYFGDIVGLGKDVKIHILDSGVK